MTADERNRSLEYARQLLTEALVVADECGEALLGALIAGCIDHADKLAAAERP